MSTQAYTAEAPRRFHVTRRSLQWGLLAIGAPVVVLGAIHPVKNAARGEWRRPQSFVAPVLRAAFGRLAPASGSAQSQIDDQAATPDVAPAAPFVLKAKSPAERARALQCLGNAIYYEAALEPQDGQRAVAQVVLNRVRNLNFPHSICGVVYQGGRPAANSPSPATDRCRARRSRR